MRGWVFGVVVSLVVLSFAAAVADATNPAATRGVSFRLSVLLRPDGGSEPAVAIGADGTVVYTALSWIEFFTNVWRAPFGSEPAFQGFPDAAIEGFVGGLDADVDIGSTGTLHMSTLMGTIAPGGVLSKLGVSAIACPRADTSDNFARCTAQIIDLSGADRQWITSDGPTVYISYHDSGFSSLIHVQRSDDDGFTWRRVASPIVGQGGVTGDSTFNSQQGPIVADPVTHNVYAIYAAGEASVQKGTTANFNQMFVSRSKDKGMTWTPRLVFRTALNTALNNVFPALAVDPTNGNLYAAWSDAHTVWLSMSTDQGDRWSPAVAVNQAPVRTALFPWIAADRSRVDVVFYGTNADSKDDPTAVWNTYLVRSTDGMRGTQITVSEHPNHVGVICTQGTACPRGTRNLLDLFEVAINPVNGKAAVIFTDDTLTTWEPRPGDVRPLPQVIVAQEK